MRVLFAFWKRLCYNVVEKEVIFAEDVERIFGKRPWMKHRGQRCIEPEAVFEQMKYNMNYKRFRHFGKDKIFMDFAFFLSYKSKF